MKKITLFAFAALAATSAFAAKPVSVVADKPVPQRMVGKSVVSTNAVPAFKAATSRADEGVVVPATSPTYVAPETFYIGLSRDWMGYSKNIGFLPAKGYAAFLNLSDAQTSEWAANYLNFAAQEQTELTFDSQHLVLTTSPATGYRNITLKATSAESGTTTTYCDSTSTYYAGDPDFWGFVDSEEDDYSAESVFGVIPTAFRGGRGTVGASAINRKPDAAIASYYLPNGTYASWTSQLEGYSDIALNGYGFYLPQTGSAYLLSSIYLPVVYEITEEVAVNFTVYTVDEEGYPTSYVLGKGSAILPAGNTAVMEPASGAYMLSVNLRAVNALGAAIASPVVVDQPVYIAMTGVNNEAVNNFNICICTGTNVVKTDYTAATGKYWHSLYRAHADVIIDATDSEGTKVSMPVDFPWVFSFSGSLEGKYVIPSDYFAFYNITYPYVENAYVGVEGFDFDAPVEGGDEVFVIDSNLDIAQLYDDYFIDAEASADWVDFQVGYVEDGDHVFSAVQVTAQPLPEGVAGRTATIDFKGYAADFTINITQGDPNASISSIVANQAAQGKVFDLQGRAVKNATKGIYIVDGKKVIL